MPRITFFTRPTKKQSKNPVSIYLRFTDGRNIDITTKSGIDVLVERFSNKTHELRQRSDYKDREIDERKLHDIKERVFSEYKQLRNNPTKEWLTSVIDRFHFPDKYNEKKNLFSFIEDFILKAPNRINPKSGRPVCYKMQREYARAYYYLKEFCNQKGREYDFDDIDLEFYEEFVQFLSFQGLATNTVGKKIQTLKIFLNAATDKGINTNLKFKSRRFYTLSEESESIYLTPEDLHKLSELDLNNNPRLDKVRDLYLVGCWTGLRFSDLKQVTQENINDDLMTIKQQKTRKKVVIPLQAIVKEILNKYNGKLPKPISNQNFNKYLKEIAKKAKLNDTFDKTITKGGKPISKKYKKWELTTTHSARRSFATNLYNSGFPTISIMAITGHKTEAAFLKYIKVTPEEHAKLLIVHWKNTTSKMGITS